MTAIYLDHNATTPLLPAARDAMLACLDSGAGNAASAHRFGRRARQMLEPAREQIATLLGAQPDEVVFTSGATEANNLAVLGLAGLSPGHILVSPIEHPSVSEPVQHLGRLGHEVETLPVEPDGVLVADALTTRLRRDTRLVAVMLANHETGAIQPVGQLAAPRLHCDAVQAIGKILVDFGRLGVDTLALSAHKFHGPPGIGALLVRRGVKLTPQLHGGHQQQGRRPGTEPVALVVGMAVALAAAVANLATHLEHVGRLRRRFLEALAETGYVLNGPEAAGLPHTLNLSFPGLKSDALLMALDLAGVACSTGSACSSGSLLPSPVLQAMRVGEERLRSAMRFSISAHQSEEEIVEAGRRIRQTVLRLRAGHLGVG